MSIDFDAMLLTDEEILASLPGPGGPTRFVAKAQRAKTLWALVDAMWDDQADISPLRKAALWLAARLEAAGIQRPGAEAAL